ncbi:MAG: hypothetical protein Q7S19_00335 [bacterium]|nr:hypothetical protein [bacterium]
MFKFSNFSKFAAASVLSLGTLVSVAYADHSWGGYHWARTANPLTLKLGDNVSTSWDSYLALASSDWSLSSVLDTVVVAGTSNPKNCRATLGRIEVCNSKYGSNGWLGIASVWTNGEHIVQATTKLNDSYFVKPAYNKPEWKAFVMCQEVGHVFGLNHQDEDFNNPNLDTCMDYTSNPLSNQHPNQHDYDMLDTIYAHLDSTNTSSQTAFSQGASDVVNHDDPKSWGKSIKNSADGRPSLYVRDLGNGKKVFTHVIWAD